jgi:hypothetical protein
VTDSTFVREVAEKGYAAGSKQLDQELDLEFYHHIMKHGKEHYLTVMRGKHRGRPPLDDDKKSFILKFPNNAMPIPDDQENEPIIRRVGASTRVSGDNQDLIDIL